MCLDFLNPKHICGKCNKKIDKGDIIDKLFITCKHKTCQSIFHRNCCVDGLCPKCKK